MKTRHLLCASATLAATAGASAAETYRFSNWNAPGEPTVVANQMFVDDLAEATDGEISFDFFTAAAILPPAAHLAGVGDGVVQIGQATTGYTPSDLPLNASVGGFGFIESNPTAIGLAYADWIMHDSDALGEWESHNVIPLGAFSTPDYTLICNTAEPITELEQIRGLKIRSYGLIGGLVKDLGGVPVSMPSSEAYQALQTGALDCASLGANFLVDANLAEVAKFSTLTRWTPAFNSPQMVLNKDFWQELTEEQRSLILTLGARTQARAHILYNAAAEKAFATSIEGGHTVVEPSESLQKALEDWVAAGVGDMAGIARDTYGVADPEAVFASFEPYVEKWGGLVRGMANPEDEEELTQLILDNLYDDIDPAVYGMN